MIQAVMVMSTQGKPRLLKFYSYQVSILPRSPTPPIFAHPTSAGSISPPKTNSSLRDWRNAFDHFALPFYLFSASWIGYWMQPPEKHQDLVRGVFQLLSARPDSVSNFVKVDAIFGPGAKLVYKHLATLYFVFVFDSSENELAVLDLVQGNLVPYWWNCLLVTAIVWLMWHANKATTIQSWFTLPCQK
jgi:hypothetical protein